MNLIGIVVAQEFADMRRSCEDGDAASCLDVATDLYLGISTAADPELAAEYAHRACEMGLGEGCLELSDYYYFGSGVEEDVEYSDKLRQDACSMGHEPACQPRD